MKTKKQLNADTLFAFQMALKGHKQFEFKNDNGEWARCYNVNSRFLHRIYHDIPDGWTRHDGEDWKGDPNTEFDAVMFCIGTVDATPHRAKNYTGCGSSFCCDGGNRIYAYKLAAKSPEKKVIPWTFNTRPKEPTFVYRKGYITDSMIVAWGDDVVVIATKHGLIDVTYDELLSDWLRSGGSVCGKEVEQ